MAEQPSNRTTEHRIAGMVCSLETHDIGSSNRKVIVIIAVVNRTVDLDIPIGLSTIFYNITDQP